MGAACCVFRISYLPTVSLLHLPVACPSAQTFNCTAEEEKAGRSIQIQNIFERLKSLKGMQSIFWKLIQRHTHQNIYKATDEPALMLSK